MADNKLQEAKKILAEAGLRPNDYKHLSYEQILKLAGIK
jgi:hypothetical protein